ncbi:hypothetical protein EK21DRAFT_12766, partial [Setomelanomma holmii]
LKKLVARLNLDIVLHGLPADEAGLSCGGTRPASSLLMPQVRRSPMAHGATQHLDVVSCWKGLSPSQGEEIAAWERIFTECLAAHIESGLRGSFSDWLRKYSDPANEVLLVSRLDRFLHLEQSLDARICVPSLVAEMISRVYGVHRSETLHRKFPWSLSTGNLPSVVHNFIRTRDCFFYTRDGARVLFDVSHSYHDGVMTVEAAVRWQMPRLAFRDLRLDYYGDETYRIIPHVEPTSLGKTPLPGNDADEDAIGYTISRSDLPLQWHIAGKFFHAPLTHVEQVCSTVNTVLNVLITTQLPAGVRFECISRYKLRARIHGKAPRPVRELGVSHADATARANNNNWFIPQPQDPAQRFGPANGQQPPDTGSPWVPSYTSTPFSKEGKDRSQELHPEDQRLMDVLLQPFQLFDAGTDDGTVIQSTSPLPRQRWVRAPRFEANDEHEGLFEWAHIKRKVSRSSEEIMKHLGRCALDKFEHLDLEVDAKRRKLEQPDEDIDANVMAWQLQQAADDSLYAHLGNVTTGPMGEAHTSPTEGDTGCWFEKLDRPRIAIPTRPHSATLRGVKHTTFPWKTRQEMCIGPPPSNAGSSYVDEITPPDCATSEYPLAPINNKLSQEQIQHNYQEFEELMKRKAAEKAYYAATIPGFDGIVSPTDENDRSFERIFLESSEAGDWESEMEGLSEGIESVCME